MKLPKKVNILGREFTVELKDGLEVGKIAGYNHSVSGAMNFHKKLILISNSLTKEDTIITFLHECHHAISYITGQSQVVNNDRFEIDAECFANGFYDVFKSLRKK